MLSCDRGAAYAEEEEDSTPIEMNAVFSWTDNLRSSG
jgi:hypothetical protein